MLSSMSESISGAVKFLDSNPRLPYLTNKLINHLVYDDLAGPPQPNLIGPADPDPACNPNRLARGKAMASELAEPFEMSFPAGWWSKDATRGSVRAGPNRSSCLSPSLEQRFDRLDVSERSSAWRRK
ncbi:hypothetical protein FHS21_006307 [Phyllobacterium trifolii]|uniref:Uncharacterized protein n=1 Tax=Phyllobacterium trifolii TaxID=300193 RepID=A0A839ULU7_9HYPH|nr:hypothetical protein [Phyllobacterium trifolii]